LRGKIIDAKQKAITAARIADSMKASEITVLDLHTIWDVTEYVVICTVESARQLRAVWQEIRHRFKDSGILPLGEETESSKWVLVDYNEVVVHIFIDEAREFYDLELLWGDAPRVEWASDQDKAEQ